MTTPIPFLLNEDDIRLQQGFGGEHSFVKIYADNPQQLKQQIISALKTVERLKARIIVKQIQMDGAEDPLTIDEINSEFQELKEILGEEESRKN